MQRYHQLLLPALQVVMSILATVGSAHLTVNNQVWVSYSPYQRMLTYVRCWIFSGLTVIH